MEWKAIVAGLGPAVLLAACAGGSGPAPTPIGPGRAQVQVVPSGSATPGEAGAPGASAATAPGGAGGGAAPAAAPGAAPGGSATGPPPGSAALLAAARPGDYPAAFDASSQGGPPPQTPRPTPCPTARFRVAEPAAVPGGAAQAHDLHLCNGADIAYQLLYPGAGLELTRASTPACGGSSFVLDPDHPLELVPAQLAAGSSWGPVAFTAPAASASGSVSGRVIRQTQDDVGGTAVAGWALEIVITIDHATVCGVQISGRIDQTGDWAPSLRLFPVTASTDTFHTPLGTITSTSHTRLLSTTPS